MLSRAKTMTVNEIEDTLQTANYPGWHNLYRIAASLTISDEYNEVPAVAMEGGDTHGLLMFLFINKRDENDSLLLTQRYHYMNDELESLFNRATCESHIIRGLAVIIRRIMNDIIETYEIKERK